VSGELAKVVADRHRRNHGEIPRPTNRFSQRRSDLYLRLRGRHRRLYGKPSV